MLQETVALLSLLLQLTKWDLALPQPPLLGEDAQLPSAGAGNLHPGKGSVGERRGQSRGGSFRGAQVKLVLKKNSFMIFCIPGSNKMGSFIPDLTYTLALAQAQTCLPTCRSWEGLWGSSSPLAGSSGELHQGWAVSSVEIQSPASRAGAGCSMDFSLAGFTSCWPLVNGSLGQL